MTCIVGIEHNDEVWMGGDSVGIDDRNRDKTTIESPKVFRRGEFLIGVTGDSRTLQTFKYHLSFGAPPDVVDPEEWLATVFVEAVREACRRTGAMGKDGEGREATSNSMIGFRGCVYVVDSSFGVVRSTNSYEAIGCGAPYALGALYIAKQHGSGSPEHVVQAALEASAHHCAGVAGPFEIISSGPTLTRAVRERPCVRCGHPRGQHVGAVLFCDVDGCGCLEFKS